MKDYTVLIENKEERKRERDKFILGYDLKEKNDGQKGIIVYCASGRELHVPESTEECVLLLMNCQIKKYSQLMDAFEIKYLEKKSLINVEHRIGIFVVSLVMSLGMMSSIGVSPLLIGFPIMILGLLVADLPKLIEDKMFIDNYKKMLMFVENEEKIKKNINDKDNKFIKKISKLMIKGLDKKRQITVNSIDKISLKELEKIISNINLKEIEEEYEKKKAFVLEKGKEIERHVRGQKRRPFEDLLTIEDVARLREIDELNYQYRINDKNELTFINVCDKYSGYDISNIKKRVRRR